MARYVLNLPVKVRLLDEDHFTNALIALIDQPWRLDSDGRAVSVTLRQATRESPELSDTEEPKGKENGERYACVPRRGGEDEAEERSHDVHTTTVGHREAPRIVNHRNASSARLFYYGGGLPLLLREVKLDPALYAFSTHRLILYRSQANASAHLPG
jgi:hypothetical protein